MPGLTADAALEEEAVADNLDSGQGAQQGSVGHRPLLFTCWRPPRFAIRSSSRWGLVSLQIAFIWLETEERVLVISPR